MIIKDWLLIIFGVEFKGDIVDVRDIYNMKFFIGREIM